MGKLLSDHVDDPTPHVKFGYNRLKGGVTAHAPNTPFGAFIFNQTKHSERSRPSSSVNEVGA